MSDDARTTAVAYFDAWRAKDFAALRALLADDVTFVGPLGTAANAEDYTAGIQRLSNVVTDIAVRKMFVDGPDVVTWFDLHTTVAPPCPTANWSHVQDGKIAAVRVAFDPRPLLPPNAHNT